MTSLPVLEPAPQAPQDTRCFDEAAAAQMERFVRDFGRMYRERNEALREVTRAHHAALLHLSAAADLKDDDTGVHIVRIGYLAEALALALGQTVGYARMLRKAAPMHDIGKITVPDSILLKPGRLTRDEFEVMKSHTTRGCEIVRMLSDIQDKEYFETSYDICRHHHEKYDGRGYPDGLKGEEISIAAQLTSIADVYDALISERVYKAAIPPGQAFDMIQSGECGAFSPKLLNCLTAAKMEMEAVFRRNRDEDEDENDDSEDT